MLGDPIPDPGTVATNRTTLVASGVAEGWPRVAGCCPACGGASLFVGEGGYVTCSMRPCPDPTAVADLLERPRGLDAESVAARLVEAICRMQDQLDGERAVSAALLIAQQMAVRGRDMARADLVAADDALDAARAEVEALQVFAQDANEAFASGRREVLADLRAKAEVLPERADAHTEQCPGRPGYRGICTCGTSPTDLVRVSDVLTLLRGDPE